MATSATKQVLEKEKPVNTTTTSTTAVSSTTAIAPERNLAHASLSNADSSERKAEKKPVGYGMPCSNCHAYYPADMHACPICKCSDRVSPNEPVAHTMLSTSTPSTTATEVDSERERLLKELKSQAFASHTQINPVTTFQCVLAHQHSGSTEPAAVCHTCYSDMRQQADRMEAALHMDVKEAAKIVYDAVWADTSDPNASYFNAGSALLTELRKRAGISLLLGSHRPLAH